MFTRLLSPVRQPTPGLPASVIFIVAALVFQSRDVCAQQAPAFTQIVVFGDSLSDAGNVRQRMEDDFFIPYPGPDFNYSEGRATNGPQTDPASTRYAGLWHEQLAQTFLGLPPATSSINGGSDYAFGGARAIDGSSERPVLASTDPELNGDFTVTVHNLGRQVVDYIGYNVPDPQALYAIWGGTNDLLSDPRAANVIATADRVAALVVKLAEAGGRNFLVPNVPPLGILPLYAHDSARSSLVNDASARYRAEFDAALDRAVATLASEGIEVQLYRLDVFRLFLRLAADPAAAGFTDLLHPSYGRAVDPDRYLFWDELHPTTAGHYQIAAEAFRVLSGTIQPQAKMLNVSTRLAIGAGDDVLICGVIIAGTQPKRVVFRAIGPSLTVGGAPFPGRLADPILELHQGETLIATNDNWRDTQEAKITASGVAPTNDREPAIARTLAPGSYTAVVRGAGNTTGVAVVEAYDLSATADSTFVNISTRGFTQTGDNVLIGGLIAGGGENATVVVRAIGPSLGQAGIANALLDPTLELHDPNGDLIASNDDWRDEGEGRAISLTGLAPADARESALVRSLAPGNYTAIVRGTEGASGVALVEAYNVR